MKFFLPFWFSDHVYSTYRPFDPNWSPSKDSRRFVWQLPWPRLPVDGILLSRINIQNIKSDRFDQGVYHALALPSWLPTFGDCGAWGYIKEKQPPFEPAETLEFYRKMRFTYACTIDHIIFPETFSERFERLDITLRNAKEMITRWNSDREYYNFQLVGVVQGWDPESYFESAKEILDLGFDYVALGGQSRAPSKFTIDVLRRCHPLWDEKPTKVHIFGLARRNLLDSFSRYGVSSFDNAYHRRAWLSVSDNYQLGDTTYTAVRIPIAKDNDKKHLESRILQHLRGVEENTISPAEFLAELVEYDSDRAKMLLGRYERTLVDRPWEKCDCIICRELGIHVIVFRSNERNMRRGFHNLWDLHKRLRHYSEPELQQLS